MSGREMAHRVAADDEALARRRANVAIELVDHFSRRAIGARGEGPAVARERRAHLKSPTPEDVERGVVVLDQLEAPLAKPGNVARDLLPSLRHAWIEKASIARKAPRIRRVSHGEQRTYPDTRTCSGAANVG